MLPGSHLRPRITPGAQSLRDPRSLADAFSEFISASTVLESSYRELQHEVARLGNELADRNAALTKSLTENERMRAVLEQIIHFMPCGVFVLDATGSVVMINPEAKRLLRLGSAELSNITDLSQLSNVDFNACCPDAHGYFENEVCLSTESGYRWLSLIKQRLGADARDASCNFQSIWILRDISASKQAEQKRDDARDAVALAEVSTMLAHEIRNPLASMELFAGLVLDDPDQSAQWVSHLRAGIRLLSGTVSNVLSIHCGANARLSPIDLAACVSTGVVFVQPVAEQAGISLEFLGQNEPLNVLGNEDGIRQVILNLVSNAIRHTPGGGAITVSAKAAHRDGELRGIVEVMDSGAGIAPELLEHLFDPGVSGDGTTPGLGLAVCTRIMSQHGGAIRVSSHVGLGTTFELEFPLI